MNINVNEKLLSQLRIIAAVQDKTVTDIVVELITAYVRDKKKDALATTSEILADRIADADKTVIAKNGDNRVEEHLVPKYPVFADGKQHPAYLLPADLQEVTESPTSDGNKS